MMSYDQEPSVVLELPLSVARALRSHLDDLTNVRRHPAGLTAPDETYQAFLLAWTRLDCALWDAARQARAQASERITVRISGRAGRVIELDAERVELSGEPLALPYGGGVLHIPDETGRSVSIALTPRGLDELDQAAREIAFEGMGPR